MATNKRKLIIFTVLFTVSTFGLTNAQSNKWVYDDSGCRTPDGGVGDCIIVRECQPMIDFLQQAVTITKEITSILRSYQCGFQEKVIKVCCPDKPIMIQVGGINKEGVTTPTSNPISSNAPDVTNHKNLHLLPPVTDCGLLSIDNRILNGNKTALFEFPWMALLSYRTRSGPDFRCGGTLINERYVLTAAHCITNLDKLQLIGVRLGEYNISSVQDCEVQRNKTRICAEPVQDMFIDEIIPHPKYNFNNFTNDIGLLRLSLPAQLKENVQPICLPIDETLRNKNFTNSKLIVTGWGATGRYSRKSDDLLKVEIPVIPEEECKKVYKRTPAIINYKQLCAGGKNRRDSCGGDSGGPLQALENFDFDLHYFQYGIVSFGPQNCGQEGFPGVYTRIDHYMDWILDNIRP